MYKVKQRSSVHDQSMLAALPVFPWITQAVFILSASAWPPWWQERPTPHSCKAPVKGFSDLILSLRPIFFQTFDLFHLLKSWKLKPILFKPHWHNRSNKKPVLADEETEWSDRQHHETPGPLAVFMWATSANNKSSKFKASPKSQLYFFLLLKTSIISSIWSIIYH